jgi:hypothetical protein
MRFSLPMLFLGTAAVAVICVLAITEVNAATLICSLLLTILIQDRVQYAVITAINYRLVVE